MAPEIRFSTQRPKLPAAFLAPQKCPPGRCRFPGAPLPPPSPIILAALTKSYFAQLRRQMAPGCFVFVEHQQWDETIALARILELARTGSTPDQIIAQVESKEERYRQACRVMGSSTQFGSFPFTIRRDCTMALYYCPPKFKFKAYYRRGIALARLQLWKKAILDFEQALLIEPHNILIKQELAAAKKALSK